MILIGIKEEKPRRKSIANKVDNVTCEPNNLMQGMKNGKGPTTSESKKHSLLFFRAKHHEFIYLVYATSLT
jgi:hypothetical protein